MVAEVKHQKGFLRLVWTT